MRIAQMIPTYRTMLSSVTLLAGVALPAGASLIGDEVEIWSRAQLNGNLTFRGDAVVTDPGVEYSLMISQNVNYTVDIDADSIRLETFFPWNSPWFNSGLAPTALEIRDLDFVGDPERTIGAVSASFGGEITVDDFSPENFPAFSADNIEFGDEWVRIVYGGYAFASGSFIDINLTFVPAPGTAALFGVAGLGAARRRR